MAIGSGRGAFESKFVPFFFGLGKKREMRHAPWRREAPCESLFFPLVTSGFYLAFGPATD